MDTVFLWLLAVFGVSVAVGATVRFSALTKRVASLEDKLSRVESPKGE